MADLFCLIKEGKDEALVEVVIVVEAVSAWGKNLRPKQTEGYEPLFSAPQQSHFKIVFLFPVELSRRLPQSVQKTRDPIADILGGFW